MASRAGENRREAPSRKRAPKTTGEVPAQQQKEPGRQGAMRPRPQAEARQYRPAGKLEGEVALISGGQVVNG